MLKGIRVLLFRVVPALCTVYVIYFLAVGGHHLEMRSHDIRYISENCPALSRQVGPLEIETRTEADWSPFLTEYRLVPGETKLALEVGRRNDLSALSCLPLITCLLPPVINENCKVNE